MRTLSRIWSPLMASTSSSTVAGTTTSTLPTFNPSPGLTFSLSCILWPTLLKGAKKIDFFYVGIFVWNPSPFEALKLERRRRTMFFFSWGGVIIVKANDIDVLGMFLVNFFMWVSLLHNKMWFSARILISMRSFPSFPVCYWGSRTRKKKIINFFLWNEACVLAF